MNDILISVKALLGIADTSKDNILNHYIDLIWQSILSYCNRDGVTEGEEMPPQLYSFITSKVIAVYNSDGGAADGSGSTGGTLKEVKSGDVTYKFGGDNFNRGFAGVAIGELTPTEKDVLNNYRLLGFS